MRTVYDSSIKFRGGGRPRQQKGPVFRKAGHGDMGRVTVCAVAVIDRFLRLIWFAITRQHALTLNSESSLSLL